MAYTPPIPLVPYWDFHPGAPIVPKLYWDAVSPEQGVHRLAQEIRKLCEYATAIATSVNLDHTIIQQLQDAFEKFVESGFDDYYKEQIEQWISDNLVTVMQTLLNQGIFFGLTEDGYFCANVLMQLTIYFDTIVDYSSDDYGKLTLTY